MHQCAVRRRPSWSVRINTSPGTRSIQRTEQRTCAGRHTRGHRRIFSAGASSSLTRRDFHGEGFFFSKFTRHGIIESLIGAPRENTTDHHWHTKLCLGLILKLQNLDRTKCLWLEHVERKTRSHFRIPQLIKDVSEIRPACVLHKVNNNNIHRLTRLFSLYFK